MNRRQERYYSVAPHITTAAYISWEIKRHIEATEAPGVHGTYGNEVAS